MFPFHSLSFWEGEEGTSPLTVSGKRALKNLFMTEKYAVSSFIDRNPSVLSLCLAPSSGGEAHRMCLSSGVWTELLLGITLSEIVVAEVARGFSRDILYKGGPGSGLEEEGSQSCLVESDFGHEPCGVSPELIE